MSQLDKKSQFSAIEAEILAYWQKNATFEESVASPPKSVEGQNNEYVFYDGPPFANGLPHYGHLLSGFIKDIVARYHTMLGKRVERKFGWDCHGLPAEMESEKELKISGKAAIQEYGIDKFNEHCRTSVMKYTDQWEDYITAQARWVDFKGSYKTMDLDYMESVIWGIKQLYQKGLLYEDLQVMPYSWKCETPVSNFETRLDNSYRQKESKAVTVKFELSEIPLFVSELYPDTKKVFMLAWTTTPWTLPSNLALAVNNEIDYAIIPRKDNNVYIMAAELAEKYLPDLN